MRSRHILVFCAVSAISQISFGQVTAYDDVAVIVNANHAGSVQIGNYFMAARSIPANRLISVEAPLTEVIDSLQFVAVRTQIEDQLLQTGALDSINYLVTTLGMPVRIVRESASPVFPLDYTSFDSEIALVLGPHEDQILANGGFFNPYFESTNSFSRASTGVFLVTRLAATTVLDVLELIDRSGPVAIDPASALIVADNNYPDLSPGVQNYLDQILSFVVDPFTTGQWGVQTANIDVVLDSLEDVIAYVSVNGDTNGFVPHFSWLPGGIYLEGNSFTAAAFETVGDEPYYAMAAKLIADGATGARGSVGPAYASEMTSFRHTLLQYLDTASRFNLGDSLFSGLFRLSWGGLVIGDPKTRIHYIDPFAGIEESGTAGLSIGPNPSNGLFSLTSNGCRFADVEVMDAEGRSMLHRRAANGFAETLDLSAQAAGMYILKASTTCGDQHRARLIIAR